MVTVNGKDKPFDKEMTAEQFLLQEGYRVGRIALEVNGTIIPKAAYGQTVIRSGDVVEVVSFVGGG